MEWKASLSKPLAIEGVAFEPLPSPWILTFEGQNPEGEKE
jgi:hypothetical protein